MTRKNPIPFHALFYGTQEIRHARRVLSGAPAIRGSSYAAACEGLLKKALKAPEILLTTSCTDALEMIALLTRMKPGDEVILPSFTFPATATAFCLRGVRPVFADIRGDTLNLDHEKIEELMTRKTRAIVAVHYGGVACEMDALGEIARRKKLFLIEDNAHGLFAKYRGKALGTLGHFSALSFHHTKNLSSGQGGALLVNAAGARERAYHLRDNGTNRREFLLGQSHKYTWVDHGSSYAMPEILAAVLYAQLQKRRQIQTARRRQWYFYQTALGRWAEKNGAALPVVPEHCEPSWHLFYLMMRSEKERGGLMQYLQRKGIMTAFHFLPLHQSAMGRRLNPKSSVCPVAESASRRLLRLPLYPGLKKPDQQRIVEEILNYR